MRSWLIAVGVLFVAAAAAVSLSAFRAQSFYGHAERVGLGSSSTEERAGYWGCYGGFMGSMTWVPSGWQGRSGVASQLAISDALALLGHPLPGSEAFPANDSVVVYSSSARLLVFTMGHVRAVNLTGQALPDYAQHEVFVIDGLIDPTLVFEGPSTVNITVINLDSSMYHNFVVTTVSPPYPFNAMPYEMQYGMVPFVPPADYTGGLAYSYSYVLSFGPGSYWYICTYPGHAEMGMYGRMLVRG